MFKFISNLIMAFLFVMAVITFFYHNDFELAAFLMLLLLNEKLGRVLIELRN